MLAFLSCEDVIAFFSCEDVIAFFSYEDVIACLSCEDVIAFLEADCSYLAPLGQKLSMSHNVTYFRLLLLKS